MTSTKEDVMDYDANVTAQKQSPGEAILATVKQVLMAPAGFYRNMPKGGGFGDPLVFGVVLGVVSGLIQAVLGLLHLGAVGSVWMALASIVLAPVMIVLGSFIGGAILFVIWKLMGSNEDFETAYRCGAYASAITPITTVVGIIPFVGPLVGLVWGIFLMVTASVEVHKLPARKAWMVFGIIGVILALLNIGSSCAAHKAQRDIGAWRKEMGVQSGKDMTAEDAGKAAAAFMKALQEQATSAAEKAKAEAEE
jgi:hypothetical protein